MGNFRRDNNRDSRGGGGRFFGGRDSGARDDRPRSMFKTVCSSCGNECEVPFKPTTGKPVYCSDCFEKVGGRSSGPTRSERPERQNFERSQSPRPDQNKVQFDALDTKIESLVTKLDKIINLLTAKVEETVIEKVKITKSPKAKKAVATKKK